MALISCPECKKKISDSAENCPNCGFLLTPEKIAEIKKNDEQTQKVGTIGCLSIIAILVVVFYINRSSTSDSDSASSLISELEKYGSAVAVATDGAVIFVSAEQTTKSPLNAFKLQFKTDRDALMSAPGAAPGNAAYLANFGRTELWSTRFCTEELKAIMSRYKIDLVSGDLTNLKGETQSISMC
jgi:hypothetical protein